MSLHVALIDKSEIVQKMLSHCLYYFSAEVLRFDSWEDSKSHFADSKPDIIFVDWEIKKGEESVVYSVIEEMKPTPVVLLYRSSYGPQINAIPSDKLSHKFIKPLDLKAIREGFIELVPQVKESKIHPFLKFPKSKAVDQSSGSELKENTISAKTYSKISLIKENDPKTPISHLQTRIIQKSLEEDKIPVGNILNPVNKTNPEKEVAQTSLSQQASAPVDGLTEPSTAKEGIQTSFSQQASGVLKEKKIDMNAISKTSTKELLIEELGIGKDQTKDEAATKNLKEDKPLEKTVSERKEPDVKSFKKQEFNIDENTQNDFAPMAIKFSDSGAGKAYGKSKYRIE